MQPKVTYGLQIYEDHNYGTQYIKCQVMRREHQGDRQDRPLGLSSDDQYREFRPDEPKHLVGLQMQGLGMYGFVNYEFARRTDDIGFIGFAIEYRDVFSVDAGDAERMHRTLKLISKRLQADHAYEPGDCLTSLCAALKLSWVVERVENDGNQLCSKWIWYSVAEGRNLYRRRIQEAVAAKQVAFTPKRDVA